MGVSRMASGPVLSRLAGCEAIALCINEFMAMVRGCDKIFVKKVAEKFARFGKSA
jgi:hypothetical protein